MRNKRTITAVAGVLAVSASCALAQDWPQWRGANRDGKASGFTAPKDWPKELTQKWKVTVGLGDATPALVGNKLYVFAREGGDEVIRCLDAANGKEIWQEKYDARQVSGPQPRSTAAREARPPSPMARSSLSVSAASSPAWMPRTARCSGARTTSPARGPGSTPPPRRSSPAACASRSSAASPMAASSPTTWPPATRSGNGPATAPPTPPP